MEWLFTPPLFGVLGATTAPDWQTIGSMIVGGLGLLGVLYTGTRSRLSSKEANDTAKNSQALTEAKTAWEEMRKMRAEHKQDREQWEQEREEDRLEREQDRREREDLHAKFDTTTRLFTMSVGYIEQIIRHIRSGGGEPLPTAPDDLRSYLAHLFDEAKEH